MKARKISLCFVVAAGLLVLVAGCERQDPVNQDPNSQNPNSQNPITQDSIANKENGHEYVDLGLSVKWASCNVGANAPEEYGKYYAWGEVVPKSDYSLETYKYCNGTYMTKYCTDSDYGTVDTVDNKTTLEAMDDAATYNWGGSWRMPTDAEWTELRNQCTWTWTTRNGKKGYEVTSKTNGNSIFLPAAGIRYDASLNQAGSYGYYWSSSLDESYPNYAWDVGFCLLGSVARGHSYRSCGESVRPVCP